jgi:hypothetical protein
VVDLAILVALLVGIFQPGGAGTTIRLHDDTDGTNHAAAPGPHTFAEIAAAFPADFTALGTNEPSYRGLVSVQIGDSTIGSQTTTLADTNKTVIWDATRTLTNATTNLASWFLNLGTKVGTGNRASGKDGCTLVFGAATTLNENLALYGCTLKSRTGAVTFGGVSGPTREIVDCIIQSAAAGTTPILTGIDPLTNAYNVDISHVTTAQVCGNFNFTAAERITISAAAPSSFVFAGAPSQSWKDIVFFGSPTQSDLRWSVSGATNWKIIRPTYSNSGNPKFSSGVITITPANGCQEFWGYNAKVIDRNGLGIANIPVKLTDTLGNVLVDALTDATGQISFGSGITADFVPVVDHYTTAGVYAIRHRSPFLSEINTGVNRNTNYQSRTFTWFWHGYSTYTTTAGSFADVNDVVPIEDGSGAGSVWVELTL